MYNVLCRYRDRCEIISELIVNMNNSLSDIGLRQEIGNGARALILGKAEIFI